MSGVPQGLAHETIAHGTCLCAVSVRVYDGDVTWPPCECFCVL